MKIDIIIPTYGQENYTVKCLKSIEKYTDKKSYRIIWVDNGSTEESRKTVLDELQRHDYLSIWMAGREGFVKAVNAGIFASNSEFVVIMNNDTEVVPYWLDRLQKPMIEDESIMLTGPTTTAQTSRQSWDILKRDFPMEWGDMPVLTGLSDYEIVDKLYEKYGDYYTCDIEAVAFFCAMLRSRIFEEIGVLDEEFEEGYSDDVDFSIRTKKEGYRIAFVPTVFIHHHNRTTFLSVYSNEEISKKLHANREKLKNKHKKE